eukprot:CAMPEP_0181191708 /NCGR_PEP_ID=MMETSP1096-20121128/12878_1 /TAXON_ID=156174 ORGANISM="Chrysochromulina ericina, Strain CCMP281" /NCGR_SAMPLE_ID=MMETSP1096 /ASSEMBLY_ACC=CAM_ASM_000453 /LENGTH=52 /DNA_ID=CAMNT_0023281023 /DNA_START=166 /DNA_END=324 /DNA_ORIENTATION=+
MLQPAAAASRKSQRKLTVASSAAPPTRRRPHAQLRATQKGFGHGGGVGMRHA